MGKNKTFSEDSDPTNSGKKRMSDVGNVGLGDVHVPAPINSEKMSKKMRKKMKKQKAKLMLPDKGDPHFMSESSGALRLALPFQFSEKKWIQYIPKPGTWKSERYGEIKITAERNKEFVDNFNKGVYQTRLPIDAEHETKLSGALGWIESLRLNGDGSVGAQVDWTDRGLALLAKKAFRYFSPEWYDSWKEPASEKVFSNVAIGGALTTRPFFKEGSLQPIIASETGYDKMELAEESNSMGTQNGDEGTVDAQRFAELGKKVEDLTATAAKFAEERDTANAIATKLAERLAAMETENTRRALSEIASKFAGETATHVALMETMSEESRNAYVTLQTALTEQLKVAATSAPLGVSDRGIVSGNTVEAVRAEAAAAVKASEGSAEYNRAVAAAWTPERYEEYLKETAH
ncbi:MAG: phage protease [Acidobacteria bacterium]|nr:phage protease [Acidobacteriota bacterium]